ncbi:MAG: cupin domain-containing protein [Synergistaceae bacterium]|nr:cupin domain-containing protein [Synergistaceae bacterium]
MKKGNLFRDARAESEERIDELIRAGSVRIERIVSEGQVSPPGFWYDQDEWEYVTVLQGSAELETAAETFTMNAGDWVIIPEHERHRVKYTSTEPPCVWLAVFGRKEY